MTNGADNLEIAGLIGSLVRNEVSGERWFDFGRNPAGTEQVGRALADRASVFQATAVVSWLAPNETVLAHIVARELGTGRSEVELDLGMLTFESELPSSSTVLLVSTFWGGQRLQRPLHSLRTLLEGQGHTVVAAASLVPSRHAAIGAEDLPLITLID